MRCGVVDVVTHLIIKKASTLFNIFKLWQVFHWDLNHSVKSTFKAKKWKFIFDIVFNFFLFESIGTAKAKFMPQNKFQIKIKQFLQYIKKYGKTKILFYGKSFKRLSDKSM